ncbi:MAG: hypothetical protein RJA10_4039 [Pseudomonadota bacterium]|jgi:hypothetical protein
MTVYDLAKTPPPADPRRTRLGRLKMLAVLAVCAAPVVASYLTYFVIKPDGRSNYGHLIQPTRSIPDVALQALDGQAVRSTSLKGQWLLVVVGPSTCDAACEKRLFAQRQLREMLGRERERLDKVWLLTDAGQPAPALLAAMRAWPEVTLLRWPESELSRWLAPEAGQALQEHLYLIDPMGEWMMRFPVTFDPAKVKRDIDRVMRASGFWDRAGR